MFGETYFAGGILLTIVGWIWLGLIESAFLRAVTRSGLIAVCMTPSIIGGHGIGVVHAIVLLFSPDLSKIGLIPNLINLIQFPLFCDSKNGIFNCHKGRHDFPASLIRSLCST